MDLNSNITIETKHCELTPAINDYVSSKFIRFERLVNEKLKIDIHLEIDKHNHIATFSIRFPGTHLRVQSLSDDIYESIDKCADKLHKLVSKYKTRLSSKRSAPQELDVQLDHDTFRSEEECTVESVNEAIEEENFDREQERYKIHKIVSRSKLDVEMLTEPEAIMRMECNPRSFLIYKSQEDQKLRLLYEMDNGDFGQIYL